MRYTRVRRAAIASVRGFAYKCQCPLLSAVMHSHILILYVCVVSCTRACATRHFISYATPSHSAAAYRNTRSALKIGGFDSVRVYTPNDLDAGFVSRNKAILGKARGAGYWIYKPYVMMHYATHVANETDTVCYMDASYEFVGDFSAVVDEWLETPPHIALALNKPNEPSFIERVWSKHDAAVIMNAEPGWMDTPQAWCGFVCAQVGMPMLQFLAEWLTYAQDPRVVTDAPSVLGPEHADFRENRHDQTVCSLLSKKWNVQLREFPSGPVHNHHLLGT